MNRSILSLVLLIILLSACKKEKAQTGLAGHWLIESSGAGEMFLNDEGQGSVVVLDDLQDTVFYRDIYSFDVIDHSSSYDFGKGVKIHWYQAYMNDDIYCDFQSVTDGDIVNEQTPKIKFHISSKIDNNSGQASEVYDLNLVLSRN